MDAKNFEYMSKKVDRYNKLDQLKNKLNSIQELLVKDHELNITVSEFGCDYQGLSEKLPLNFMIEEYDDLFREIKDNLIDTIGMKIIEINQIMEEL